jgi:hypothetical protein
VEQKVLKEEGVFKKPLERFGECDCQSSFALFTCVLFEFLEEFADFLPFTNVLFLGLFGGMVR